MDDDPRVREWERRGAVPLLVASLLFLTAYTVRVLAPDLGTPWDAFWEAVTALTWAVFAVDYAARLALSRHRGRFVRSRWLDLVVVVLPLLRPLLVVQIHERLRQRRRQPRLELEARVMTYAGLATLLLGFGASLAVYHDERSAPGATIRTFGDAVWWACSAVTTTGYGDVTPVTVRGRVVAVGVMVLGVVLIGAVVGSFSSWLLRRFRVEGETAQAPGSE